MPHSAPVAFGRDARRLKLDTLVRLRWLAVTGQCAAVAFVHLQLGYRLPFELCLAAIGVSAAINVVLRAKWPASHRLGDGAATAILAFDILQLAALLYLTGGLQNPFSILFLAPVLISAAALPPQRTVALGLLAVICASVLAFYHRKLPWPGDSVLELPFPYVAGIWTAILLGIAFTGAFAYRVAEEARQLGEALVATEFVLAREQHLSQLDGLAAAAAHELGTPLATIRLVAKELALQVDPDDPAAEDIRLLRDQVERCRVILSKLTSLETDDGGGFLATMTIGHMIEEVIGPRHGLGLETRVELEGEGREPSCRRSPGLLYGLGNLVDNAADFAASLIRITASWDEDVVAITIRDDGPGFSPEVLLRVGEPYVTTRGGGREEGASGLGLGLFIAKTLIERSGARLELSNAPAPGSGAIARITWPRHAFEQDARAPADDSASVSSRTLSEAAPLPI